MVLRDDTGFPRPGDVQVTVLPPVMPDKPDHLSDDEKWRAGLRLRANIRSQILSRCGEPDLAHERVLHLLDPSKQ